MGFDGMDIVGESHRIDALHQIIRARMGGRLPQRGELVAEARLVREPDNPVDSEAVAVYIDGLQVGYIPKGKTGMIRDAFVQGQAWADGRRRWWRRSAEVKWLTVEAMIGWGRTDRIGVRLTGIDEETGRMQGKVGW
mgnify:CR=1 FL=1